MADRRIGRKPQKRKGLFSFFSKKERKPIPERPQAKQLGKKTQARKPGEVPIGKRPVRGKPVPPQEEFKAMRKNMDLAKKAGKTIKLTRAQVERYNQLAKKFGKPPLKERKKVKKGEPEKVIPEIITEEEMRKKFNDKYERWEESVKGKSREMAESEKPEFKLDDESARKQVGAIKESKYISSEGATITPYELDKQWGYKQKWLEPLRKMDLQGADLVQRVRVITGLGPADAARLIEIKFGRARLENPEARSKEFLELKGKIAGEEKAIKINFPEFEKTFNAPQRNIEAAANYLNFQLAGDLNKWKKYSERSKREMADMIADKAKISPELAYAVAETVAERGKKEASLTPASINLANNAESKLVSSFGGKARYLKGMDAYMGRLRSGDPKVFTTREQLVDDFIRRGLTKAEADAFIDQHNLLSKYSIEVGPIMGELKKKLKVSAKDLIEINASLESEIVGMAKYLGKGIHGSDYSKTYIESGLHQLYKDIAKERGLNYSVVAAIGERIYKEKEAEIEEALRKEREKSRDGARTYNWGNASEEEAAKEEARRREEKKKNGKGSFDDGVNDDI